MPAEYKLSSDAPYSILVEGEGSLDPFVAFMDGKLVETMDGDIVEIPFTPEHAQKLRMFLKGKDVEIPDREKAILAYLADHPGSETDEKVNWHSQLTELRKIKAPGKFTKIKDGWDLIHYLPLRYLDKTNPQTVSELSLGAWGVIAGTVIGEPMHNAQKKYVKIVVADVKGTRISATFFRQEWLRFKFHDQDEVILYGNYSEYINGRGQRFPQITNAKIDKLGTVRGDLNMVPIYPQKSEDKSWQLQQAQRDMIDNLVWIEDPVPAPILKKHGFMSRNVAYREIHFPRSRETVEEARRRIAFDEFVRLQVFLENRRDSFEEKFSSEKTKTSWADRFIKSLPFEFTDGQKKVTEEIKADMATSSPMYRLLQGDVGHGKSEVASVATLVALESGTQVALLAPTDILASQLYERFEKTFAKAGLENEVHLGLINGRVLGKKRKLLLENLQNGEINILIGTHAIISESVEFQNLGLVIIDEQHRFGSGQRTALRDKGANGKIPDFLMMSATPIPRTVSQVAYGDMDISIIDGAPIGRMPVKTEWHKEPDLAWAKIREEVEKGRQAYVVASLVEDTDKLENIESATSTYLQLANDTFPDLNVGLLHGKLPKEEKEAIINQFYRNEIQILVATSVIEVGVNVPNATVMTILNANRFGIASLHQIRGRVGRGLFDSYCYLIGEATVPEAEERLAALVESNDGFWLAEKDLEIRGEGSLFGQLQSGENDLFVGNLKEHKDMLELSKKVAKQAKKSVMLKKEVELLYSGKDIKA